MTLELEVSEQELCTHLWLIPPRCTESVTHAQTHASSEQDHKIVETINVKTFALGN